jgi:hypothetical protein
VIERAILPHVPPGTAKPLSCGVPALGGTFVKLPRPQRGFSFVALWLLGRVLLSLSFDPASKPIVLASHHQQMGGACIVRGSSLLAQFARLGSAVFGVHASRPSPLGKTTLARKKSFGALNRRPCSAR